MIKIVRPFLFLAFFMLMYTTSLAISFSRIGTITPQNALKLNLCVEKLTLDSPEDSLLVDDELIYDIVEVEPSFPGGSDSLIKWMQSNLSYPKLSYESGEQGVVYVKFIVGKDGIIRDVKIAKGVSELLDNEATRVVKAMPKWNPGMQAGKKVSVRYILPILFQIDPNEKKENKKVETIELIKHEN
jgi:TonB family protein